MIARTVGLGTLLCAVAAAWPGGTSHNGTVDPPLVRVFFRGHIAFADSGGRVEALLPHGKPDHEHAYMAVLGRRGVFRDTIREWSSMRFAWASNPTPQPTIKKKTLSDGSANCLRQPFADNADDAGAFCWVTSIRELHEGTPIGNLWPSSLVAARVEMTEGILQTSDLLDWGERGSDGRRIALVDFNGPRPANSRVVAVGVVLIMAAIQSPDTFLLSTEDTVYRFPLAPGDTFDIGIDNLSVQGSKEAGTGRPCADRQGKHFADFYRLMPAVPPDSRFVPEIPKPAVYPPRAVQPAVRNPRTPRPFAACSRAQRNPAAKMWSIEDRPICPIVGY